MNHAPKTAALMAYESGALSTAGRARVERHLRGCIACQRELAVIQSYEATVDAIRDDRGPDLDWSKMELALEREAQVQAKKHRRGWVLPASGVLLAAAVALMLVWPTSPSSDSSTVAATTVHHVVDREPSQLPVPTVVEHEDPYASSSITLLAGASQIHTGEDVTVATLGRTLASDDRLATNETSSLEAVLGEGIAVALAPSSTLRLGSLDVPSLDGAGDETVPALALDGGRMGATVREARTLILAGEFRIEIEVASFLIDFDAETQALALDLRSGHAHVTGPGVDAELDGPARFPADAPSLQGAVPTVVSEPAAAIHVRRDDIVRWQVGDVSAVGADELAMRVGLGPTTISGWDAHGRIFRAAVMVGADGLDLTPDELVPSAPRVRQGVLAPEDILPVVRQHGRDLRRCYEHELRATPTLSVHVTARISVEMTGSVADDGVQFGGDPMPETMQRCLSNQIQTWIFPAPEGGPVTVPVPFAFTTN